MKKQERKNTTKHRQVVLRTSVALGMKLEGYGGRGEKKGAENPKDLSQEEASTRRRRGVDRGRRRLNQNPGH